MNKKKRILTGLLICILIICAGFATGIYLKQTPGKPAPVASMAIASGAPNDNIYDVSPASSGVTLITYDIDISPAGDISFMALPKTGTGSIAEGQKIMLYDSNRALLDTLGEVTRVVKGTDQLKDSIIVHIKLNGDEDVPPSEVAHGKIITGHNPDAQRLPLSALVKNEKDEPFVWEVNEAKDGTSTAKLRPANVAEATYDYFVIQPTDQNGHTYILNPDKALTDGQNIRTNKMTYSAPAQTDLSRISALMETRARARAEKIGAMLGGTSSSAGEPAEATAGCPAPPPKDASAFIEQVRKMAPTAPQSLPTSP